MKKPKNYWTLDRCKADALKFKSRSEWMRNSAGAYAAATFHGWSETTDHMQKQTKTKDYWTLENCKKVALQFANLSSWRKQYPGAFNAALRNKWIKDCTNHMSKNMHITRHKELFEAIKAIDPEAYEEAVRLGFLSDLMTSTELKKLLMLYLQNK